MMDFQELVHAIHLAEAEGDIDGCAACQIQMLEMTKAHPELLRIVDTTYLRIDYLMRILAAAVLAFGRGEWKLAKYYMQHFPSQFLKRQGCFPEHQAMLGRISYAEGSFGEAAQFLKAHLAAYPQDEMAWFWLGNTEFQQKQFSKAVAAYTRALHQKESLREASENRAAAFQEMCTQGGAVDPAKDTIPCGGSGRGGLGGRTSSAHLHQLPRPRWLSFPAGGLALASRV
ncbi:MAG: tetratricopeptide repeat protein [Veillonellaceae bacterium]|nr:tetratricopeptide repeat protein [Veillonellaceae bacterium]